MRLVGERYERGEYFLAELIMAGVTMNEAMELIRPSLGGKELRRVGKVVIGTVEGDLHDIGKNMRRMLFQYMVMADIQKWCQSREPIAPPAHHPCRHIQWAATSE
jgi:hypothetical protein